MVKIKRSQINGDAKALAIQTFKNKCTKGEREGRIALCSISTAVTLALIGLTLNSFISSAIKDYAEYKRLTELGQFGEADLTKRAADIKIGAIVILGVILLTFAVMCIIALHYTVCEYRIAQSLENDITVTKDEEIKRIYILSSKGSDECLKFDPQMNSDDHDKIVGYIDISDDGSHIKYQYRDKVATKGVDQTLKDLERHYVELAISYNQEYYLKRNDESIVSKMFGEVRISCTSKIEADQSPFAS
jgi:hypothetical protein